MKYAMQATQTVYPNWQGTITFGEDGEVTGFIPCNGFPLPDIEQVKAAHAGVEVKQATLAQIAQLEALESPRRLAEAVLGKDGGWLAQNRAKIDALRGAL